MVTEIDLIMQKMYLKKRVTKGLGFAWLAWPVPVNVTIWGHSLMMATKRLRSDKILLQMTKKVFMVYDS